MELLLRQVRLVGALVLVPSALSAQHTLKVAGHSGLVFKDSAGSISYDSKENELALSGTWYSPSGGTPRSPMPTLIRLTTLKLGFATKKNIRSIFVKRGFSPGSDLTLSRATMHEPRGSGGWASFLAIRAEVEESKTATFTDAAKTLIETKDGATPGLAMAGGLNWTPAEMRENVTLAVSAELQRVWNASEADEPSEVCINSPSAVDRDGNTVSIRSCENRLVGEISNETLGHFRLDGFLSAFEIGTEKKRPSLAVIGATTATIKRSSRPTYDVALGPAITPPGEPQAVLFAVLFEVADVTDASPKPKPLGKRFGIRLYVGLPFSLEKLLP
jgi:hypothetical protein